MAVCLAGGERVGIKKAGRPHNDINPIGAQGFRRFMFIYPGDDIPHVSHNHFQVYLWLNRG